MKTMLGVTFNFLKEKKISTFKQIWTLVSKEMKVTWKTQFPKKLIKDIENVKIGELYTLLTVDGRFIRTNDQKFGLVEDFTYQEVQAMKINIGEMPD